MLETGEDVILSYRSRVRYALSSRLRGQSVEIGAGYLVLRSPEIRDEREKSRIPIEKARYGLTVSDSLLPKVPPCRNGATLDEVMVFGFGHCVMVVVGDIYNISTCRSGRGGQISTLSTGRLP